MGFQLKTKRDYDFYEVSSAFQKAIRRKQTKLAGYFGLELFHSGYAKYVWKRLFTISAEDCAGIITKEVAALHEGFLLVNDGKYKGKDKKDPKGRIFITKAIILLSLAAKSRDADHLQCLVYNEKLDIDDKEIESFIESIQGMPYQDVPDYAFDVHTKKGKQRGKTKKEFFKEEHEALKPLQTGLFDHLVNEYTK